MNRKYWEKGVTTKMRPKYCNPDIEEKHMKDTPLEEYGKVGPWPPREVNSKPSNPKPIRTFDSGATRDKDDHKNDYEGFFSPLVFRSYGDYMQKHRTQKDGSIRASDNWQKGMGLSAFMKSKWRHFVDIWTIFDGYKAVDFDGTEVDLEDALCADLFNTMGYLHEVLKAKLEKKEEPINARKYTWDNKSPMYISHCPNCNRPAGECTCCQGPCECEHAEE